jgi:hypothetical protein
MILVPFIKFIGNGIEGILHPSYKVMIRSSTLWKFEPISGYLTLSMRKEGNRHFYKLLPKWITSA